MKNILLVLLLSGLLLACGGNEKNDEPEKSMSEQVEDAANDVADGAEEVANDVAEGAEEAADDVAEGAEEAAEKVKENVNNATSSSKGEWTGKVVKLTDAISGNYESLSTARVKELVMAGQYVGFLTGGKFYMVYNAAGNYDWKSLARVAGQESVVIKGKVKNIGGLAIIMATNVAS